MIKQKVHSFEQAANVVAHEFFKDMQDYNFETFKEMSQYYWWDAKDIKEEVSSILDTCTENAWMWDDLTHVVVDFDDMLYRDFKKMYMARITDLVNMKNR